MAESNHFNPFPGLRPFKSDEDYLFFGREDQTLALLQRLGRNRFLAVVGASGSGKSSLVRAGLLPALHGGFMEQEVASWHIALFRPGSNPIHALAGALNELALFGSTDEARVAVQAAILEATLRRGALGLVDVAEQTRMPEGENLLIVVDQFEELFRFKAQAKSVEASNDAAAFVKLLLEAARTEHVPIYVVLTMRSDYLGDCSQFRNLPETINDCQFLVPRMTRTQRQMAIEGPVAVGGAAMTPRLVQRLLNDVGDNPDQLPILQHALMRTWNYWKEHRSNNEALDISHYEEVGGLAHALSQHGDEVYDELPDERSREIAEALFKRLTDKGLDARGIRRPTQLDELCAVCQAFDETLEAVTEKVKAVIEAFRRPGRSLLMPPAGTPLEADTMIDISHESLMRVWDKLKGHDEKIGWLEEEAESARTYRRLAERAVDYEAGRETLLHDPQLQLALNWRDEDQPTAAWAGRYDPDPEHPRFETAVAFLKASEDLREREAREREEEQRLKWKKAKELAIERGRAEMQARRTLIVTVLAIIALVAAGFAFWQYRVATKNANRAVSAQWGSQARLLMDSQIDLALLLSVEASERALTFEAQSSLLTALLHSPHLYTFLRNHPDRIYSVAFNPDTTKGLRLASGSRDKTIILWDFDTGLPLDTLTGHRDFVYSVAFSPDGARLASGSRDSTIIVWDLDTQQRLGTLTGHQDIVYSVAFSPDGARLASGSYDNTIILWDLDTGLPLDTFIGHEGRVQSVAFSPDGARLASGGSENSIIVWDLDTQQRLGTLTGHQDIVYSVAFSPDGARLASGSRDKTIMLWDLDTGLPLDTLIGHQDFISSVAFSPDTTQGRHLASSSYDNTIIVWDLDSRQPLDILAGHQNWVQSVAFSPDGRRLASGSYDNTVGLWDLDTQQLLGASLTKPSRYTVLSVAFNPDTAQGLRLASGSRDSEIKLWNLDTQQPPDTLAGHQTWVLSVAFSPDGRRLASGSRDKKIIVWDVKTQAPLDTLTGHEDRVLSVAFSPDGRRLASGSRDNTIKLWDLDTGLPLDTLTGHQNWVQGVAFSPDGARLASGSRDNTIKLWDLDTGLPLDTLTGHEDRVQSVAFSPDGARLASGSRDNTIILWDLDTKRLLYTLAGHQRNVQSVAFSPDGARLASGSSDGEIRLWDLDVGQSLGGWITGGQRNVQSVAFSPDGRRLASGGSENSIMLWDVRVASWKALACRQANRNLTREEWTQYIGADVPYRRTCPDLPLR